MIAIHNSEIGFHPRWVKYCSKQGIPFKSVDCYDSNIIEQLEGCDALLWHHWQVSYRDILKAKRILFALEHAGVKVFPNFKSGWHFDDKISQKYLLEALKLPLVKSYHFIDEKTAVDWAEITNFPKVFKLKAGAGSANVKLVKNKKQALSLIRRSFNNGFSVYDGVGALKERFDKFCNGKDSAIGVLKSFYRLFYPPLYSKLIGRLKFEVYFQDFISNNDSDIRVIVIGNRAFAIKRIVRENDFRASGSGNIFYERELFTNSVIQKSFQYSKALDVQVVAFDFVFQNNEPLIVEISYGYAIEGYDKCEGFWDENLNFYPGPFDSTNWIIDDLLKEIKRIGK
jgi:glutathione synthase/RimK-type ligase-like ATP-grasp enzyme